jgi:hypothetical protein
MSNELDLNMLRKLIGLPAQVSEQQVNEEKCEECSMDPCTCDHIDESKVDEADVEEGNEFSHALQKAKAAGQEEFEVGGKKYKVNECGEMPMMSPMSDVGDTDAMAAVIAPGIAADQMGMEPEAPAMAPEAPAEEPASYTLSIRNGDSTLNMTTDSPDEIIHVMKLAGVKGEATVKKAPAEGQDKVDEEWENTPDATRERDPRSHGDIRDWGQVGTGKDKGYAGTKASGDNPLSDLSEDAILGEYKSFKF